MSELSEWYKVIFDSIFVYRDVRPPGGEPWKDQFEWDDVVRICFQTGDLYTPDEIYVFVKDRKESYLIPMETNGGLELWGEIIDRGLFDTELAIKVTTESETSLNCWPEITRAEMNELAEKTRSGDDSQ
ncbi:MAG: hypothetical protein ACXABO_16505 [Promethearchaeota archaeon]|jgi:hypothetical protein